MVNEVKVSLNKSKEALLKGSFTGDLLALATDETA
jgi:hypothetical protein